jgi:predicted metal-binding membrane protein
MTLTLRERRRINIAILLTSLATWMMLLVNPGGIMTFAHCAVSDSGPSAASIKMLVAMNPPFSLAAGWLLMLAAMMLPTLLTPIAHILERSFKSRRARSLAFFISGYTAVWMAAGGILVAVKFGLIVLAPQSYVPAAAVFVIALVWQCSPMKQRCLNRNHNHRELAAFGFSADLDALRFGVTHGAWCAGSCWALMLFPMLLPSGHLAAMAIVTFVMISERLEQPQQLGWHFSLRGKLMRIAIAQTRLRLHGLS